MAKEFKPAWKHHEENQEELRQYIFAEDIVRMWDHHARVAAAAPTPYAISMPLMTPDIVAAARTWIATKKRPECGPITPC